MSPLITEFSDTAWNLLENADARINIADGSVRSGKTIASLVKWLLFLRDAPDGELLMVGKTERTLRRNVFDILAEWLPKDFKHKYGSGEIWIGDRRIYYAGANDERSEEKIRGLTLAGAYGDEISIWPESFFKQLMARLSVPNAKFFGTTNPDGPRHWLNTNYLQRESELDLKRFRFKLEDNPGLSPEYIESLKQEYSGLWYQRYVEGLWSAAEGIVYEGWNPSTMVVDRIPEIADVWVAVDYGTSHATCFLLFGLGVDGKCYILDEYYHKGSVSGQKSPAEYSYDFRKWLGGKPYYAIFVDPSAEAFATQLRYNGVETVRNAENAVMFGIEVVSSLMSLGLLKVHKDCKNLIEEIPSYQWDKKAQARGIDKPLKENDDACDTMRYGIASRAWLWRDNIINVLQTWDSADEKERELDAVTAV